MSVESLPVIATSLEKAALHVEPFVAICTDVAAVEKIVHHLLVHFGFLLTLSLYLLPELTSGLLSFVKLYRCRSCCHTG